MLSWEDVLFRSSKFKEFSLLESTVGGYANIFLVKGLKTALEMSILSVCAGFQLPNFLLDQDIKVRWDTGATLSKLVPDSKNHFVKQLESRTNEFEVRERWWSKWCWQTSLQIWLSWMINERSDFTRSLSRILKCSLTYKTPQTHFWSGPERRSQSSFPPGF